MQSTLKAKYSRSLSVPGNATSNETRIVFESALRRSVSQQRCEQSQQETVLVNRDVGALSNVTACEELGGELVTVSTQIDWSRKIQEIVSTIIGAVSDQNVRGISEPFFQAVESIVNQKVNVDTFVNVTVFCITLIRRYRAASPSSLEDRAEWLTEQVYELMEAAYRRYRIADWIKRQGGWTGVLRLVRKKYQTITDYATGGQGFTRQHAAIAGTVVVSFGVAFMIWYNW